MGELSVNNYLSQIGDCVGEDNIQRANEYVKNLHPKEGQDHFQTLTTLQEYTFEKEVASEKKKILRDIIMRC